MLACMTPDIIIGLARRGYFYLKANIHNECVMNEQLSVVSMLLKGLQCCHVPNLLPIAFTSRICQFGLYKAL